MTTTNPRYQAPDAFTRRVMNPLVARATRLGLSLWGSRVLEVAGRTSGQLRRTPVNVLTVDGRRYLVAPRGTTEWVRNVRAADGVCRLRLGRRTEEVCAREIADSTKPAVLRAYLKRWRWEAGKFFAYGAEATDDELLSISRDHPVFEVVG